MAGHGRCFGWSDLCDGTYSDAKALCYPIPGNIDVSFIIGPLPAKMTIWIGVLCCELMRLHLLNPLSGICCVARYGYILAPSWP